MVALAELSSDELLKLCSNDNQLPSTSIPSKIALMTVDAARVHIIDGTLVRVKQEWDYRTNATNWVAAVVNDQYTLDAEWLQTQNCEFVDYGGFRYVVDCGDDLVIKAPYRINGEYQILEELVGSDWLFPTVDRTDFMLPSGTLAMLQEKLLYCGPWGRRWSPPMDMPLDTDPIPEWAYGIGDGGQVGWSRQQQKWVAYDFNDPWANHERRRITF